GGTEIVLATDLVVAAKDAKFGIPEVKRGLVAAGGGLLRLPHRIPYQKALELALTGDSFTAEEASQWGFVNVLTETGGALDGALALAERITANGPLAVAVTKEIIAKSAGWSEAEMWKKQNELVMPVFSSKDAMEGATAFAEKRKPNWTGA
ncbi:MAG: enoyl-CoA hydratase, partial [Mycolicibacterium sp.]|nr:enoyl-CoA hydratase [Mycolicibacterium sp.]